MLAVATFFTVSVTFVQSLFPSVLLLKCRELCVDAASYVSAMQISPHILDFGGSVNAFPALCMSKEISLGLGKYFVQELHTESLGFKNKSSIQSSQR